MSRTDSASSDFTSTIVPRICTVEGCSRPHCARGWCGRHYMIWYYHGDPMWTRPPKPLLSGAEIIAEMRAALARLIEEVAR